MKAIFFGSSHLSTIVLNSLVNAGIDIPLVVTKAPKRKGRGRNKASTPVAKLAMELSLNSVETDYPNSPELEEEIEKTGVNTFVLASYGAILKKNILNIVDYPLNIHPSLLPKYRGAAPVARALMNGEKKTGISIFLMSMGVDTGDIIKIKEVPIKPLEVRTELQKRLFREAAAPILSVLTDIEEGREIPTFSQDDSKASYAPKIKKEELKINWTETAFEIEGKVRGLSYKPGAFCIFKKKKLKVLRAKQRRVDKDNCVPGEVINVKQNLKVKCGEGSVELIELQLQGRKKVDAKSFINGYHLKEGEKLN